MMMSTFSCLAITILFVPVLAAADEARRGRFGGTLIRGSLDLHEDRSFSNWNGNPNTLRLRVGGLGHALGGDLQSSGQQSNDPAQRRARALFRQFTKEAKQQ